MTICSLPRCCHFPAASSQACQSLCGGAIHRCCEWSSPSCLLVVFKKVKIKKAIRNHHISMKGRKLLYFLSSHDLQNIYPLFVCLSLSREGRYQPGKGILQCLYLTEPLLFSVTTEWRAGSALVPPQTCSQTVTNGGKGRKRAGKNTNLCHHGPLALSPLSEPYLWPPTFLPVSPSTVLWKKGD